MYDFKPQYIHHREKEIERQRREQRIAFALRNQPDTSTSIANDSVTFQKNHYTSMEDALKELDVLFSLSSLNLMRSIEKIVQRIGAVLKQHKRTF